MQDNPYPFKSREWYKWTHEEAQAMHGIFLTWVASKASHIQSVVEIGCGLHDFYEGRFLEMGATYIGIDHDRQVVIQRLKGARSWRSGFIHVDMMDETLIELPKADLVFSRATIDHVSDPDRFMRLAIEAAERYVYIMTYRPPLLDEDQHRIEHGTDGYCYNDLSMRRIEEVIGEFETKSHQLHVMNTGRPEPEIQTEMHIEIEV